MVLSLNIILPMDHHLTHCFCLVNWLWGQLGLTSCPTTRQQSTSAAEAYLGNALLLECLVSLPIIEDDGYSEGFRGRNVDAKRLHQSCCLHSFEKGLLFD